MRTAAFRILLPTFLTGLLLIIAPTASVIAQQSQDCEGAAEWLAASEDRFLPLAQIDENQADPNQAVMQSRDLMLRGQEGQAASNPPPAAEGLNSQILATFALGVATRDRVLDGADSVVTDEDLDSLALAIARTRSMARELKRECNLTQSGDFFDAACYSLEAEAWYFRTTQRAKELSVQMHAAQDEVDQGLTPEEDAALSNQLAESGRELAIDQGNDLPPAEFADIQEWYVAFFHTNSTMFANSMTATEEEWVAVESELMAIAQGIDRERAQLDIACE